MHRALSNAGVAVLATVPSVAGGIDAPTLLAELYVFFGDSVTARLPRVRSADAHAAWIAAQLATLGPSSRYYAVVGSPSTEWAYIEAPDPQWLARAWAADPHLVLLLSEDGTRLLMLLEIAGIPDTLALTHATSDVLAMRADRERLDATLASIDGLLRVPCPPARCALRTDELYAAPVFTTLPAVSSDDRLHTWFTDVFERWRKTPPALEDVSASHELGPYEVSLAGAPCIASFAIYADAPAVLAAIWTKAGRNRFVILDAHRTRALALSRTDGAFEARIALL